MFDYLLHNPARVWGHLLEHLILTGVSLLIATLIALPLGVLLTRRKPLQGPMLGVLAVIYTIPSLALFVLLIPFFGLGIDNGIVALVLYAQVILVRQVVAGLEGVSPAIIEAARGMGMSTWQRFWRVELPLALPTMLAGLRVATLSTIGIGTVAALVGAGGLGRLLFDGVQQNNPGKIWAGAIAVSLLALGINGLLRSLERYVAYPRPTER